MSLDENKEWRKRVFGSELENIYDVKNQNGMTCIHENKVDKISEQNLLHYILNPSKNTNILNIHYSPILHARMNTQKGRENIKKFRILLDSGCGSMIVMGS